MAIIGLDRNSWGDVHDDAVTFTLTATVGPDLLAGHLTSQLRALAGGSLLLPSLFEHPAAELSVCYSAQLCEDRRQPDHIA